jgi:hypothetical protein
LQPTIADIRPSRIFICMSKRAIAFTLAAVLLLLAAMFYGGMFMHGD